MKMKAWLQWKWISFKIAFRKLIGRPYTAREMICLVYGIPEKFVSEPTVNCTSEAEAFRNYVIDRFSLITSDGCAIPRRMTEDEDTVPMPIINLAQVDDLYEGYYSDLDDDDL